MTSKADRERRVERLLGRRVRGLDDKIVGRVEEIRAEAVDDTYEVVEYHLGPGALLERLGLVSRLLGRKPRTYIVRWDQLDVGRDHRPRLTCDISEIRTKRS